MNADQNNDVKTISALIARQFASLNWRAETPADWDAFAADFAPDAVLYASARPAKRQSVDEFIARMKSVAGSRLHTFHEKLLGAEIRVFGSVAVAAAGCEITENGDTKNRSVEMMLLVKDQDVWKIVAQAWDAEGPAKPIPSALLTPYRQD